MADNVLQFNCDAVEDTSRYNNLAFVHSVDGTNFYLTRVYFTLAQGITLDDFEFAFAYVRRSVGDYYYFPCIAYRTPNIASGTRVIQDTWYRVLKQNGTSVTYSQASYNSLGNDWCIMNSYIRSDPGYATEDTPVSTIYFAPIDGTLLNGSTPVNIVDYIPANTNIKFQNTDYRSYAFPTIDTIYYETTDGYTNVQTDIPFIFNGNQVDKIVFNGTDVEHLVFNGN